MNPLSMENPRVSVALCSYNGAKYLPAQLDSILAQTYPVNEIVIVDDCSSDGTMDIIKKYASENKSITFYVNEKNLGYVGNFSKAISLTSGDYVALSDQDDIWTQDHIEKLVRNIGNKAICVADCMMVDSEGTPLGKTFSEVKKNFYIPKNDAAKAYRIIYNYNPYQGASMLIDRAWVQHFLPIPKGIGFHDTYFAACASLSKGLEVVPDIINHYRMHEDQVSKKWEISLYRELHTRKHFICFPGKDIILDRIEKVKEILSPEGISFIGEFKRIMELDQAEKRWEVLRIKNSHYKEIYSCNSYKHIVLRSLHFLLAQ